MSELATLQEALAAEQAVVYGYGVVGAHLSGAEQTYAADRLTAHQSLRDQLTALVTSQGATPAASMPAYQLPLPVSGATSAKQLAAHLEDGSAGAAWDLTAGCPRSSAGRTIAVGWLTDAAMAGAHWGLNETLPGKPSAS